MSVSTKYSGGITYINGFAPYRGKDVKVGSEGYQRLEICPFGFVWAMAYRNSKEAASLLGEEYTVQILGWGRQPNISWQSLSQEQQQLLLTTI